MSDERDQKPGTPAPPAPPPGRPGQPDDVSLWAFITGLLSLGPVPLVLGIIGLHRVRRRGTGESWMAITGIVLGAVTTLAGVVAAALVVGLFVLGHTGVHGRCGPGDGWSTSVGPPWRVGVGAEVGVDRT